MKKEEVKNLFDNIWVKIILMVSLTVALFFGLRWAYRKLFPPKPAGDVNQNALSFTIAQYKAFADRLESAMDGSGTDEAAVQNILNQMITGDDLKQLVNSFGIRTKGIYPFSDDWNLTQWIQNEFSGNELSAIQERFNQLGVLF